MVFKTNSLESMCELVVDCPHSTPEWTESGFIVLRNQNIRNGQLDLSTPSYTNENGYQSRIKRAIPHAGDIVFTREAPMGEVCMIPEGLKCCLGQRQVLLRPKKTISGKYLYWALQSPFVQHQISWNEGTGTTVSNVRIPILKDLQIPRRGESEHVIADVLSSLAEKIQINRQTNQTLEQIAQAIFKSWFVDFEPVKAKIAALEASGSEDDALLAAMTAISGKSNAELEQFKNVSPEQYEKLKSTAELFPSEMQDSGSGEIPLGWGVTSFAEWNTLKRGRNITKSKAVPGDIPVVGGGLAPSYYHNEPNVDGPVITVSASGANAGYVNLYNENIWASDCSYLAKKSAKHFYSAFTFLRLSQKRIFDLQTGAVQPHVYAKDFDRLHLALPVNMELMDCFENIAAPQYEYSAALELESGTLAGIRDTLLPRLLSGEIDVNAITD